MMTNVCLKLASELVDPSLPGQFNQSLMEFGSTICTPTSPSCGTCPLSSVCRARMMVDACPTRGGDIEDLMQYRLNNNVSAVTYFPIKVLKKVVPEVCFDVCVILATQNSRPVIHLSEFAVSAACRYLLIRRPNCGLLARQWEFPTRPVASRPVTTNSGTKRKRKIDVIEGVEEHGSVKQFVMNTCKVLGVKVTPGQLCISSHNAVKHVFSQEVHHYNVTSVVVRNCEHGIFEASLCKFEDRECCWLTFAEMKAIGLTSGCYKIVNSVVVGP
jgi:adenine-specific DNA glycosylase